MLKIKDYIFNENEIEYIMKFTEKELQVVFKNYNIYIDGTFEDIEFDYEYKQDNEYVNRLNNQIKELEEENNRLHKIIDKYEEEKKLMY